MKQSTGYAAAGREMSTFRIILSRRISRRAKSTTAILACVIAKLRVDPSILQRGSTIRYAGPLAGLQSSCRRSAASGLDLIARK
jgi:hypothetical protein